MRLRTQYALHVGCAVAVSAIVTALIFGMALRRTAKEISSSSTELALNMLAEHHADKGIALAETLAETLRTPLYMGNFYVARDLARATASSEDIIRLRIYDADGLVIQDGTVEMTAYGQPADTEVRERVLMRGEALERAFDGFTRIAVPITLMGKRLGAVEIDLDSEHIAEELASLRSAIDEKMAERGAQANRRFLFYIVGVLALALLIGSVLGRRLSAPILELKAAAERIRNGARDITTGIAHGDEIGDLARAIEDLAQSLAKTTVSMNYLDELIEGMPDAVVVVVSASRITRTNRAGEALFRASRSDIVGLPIDELLPPSITESLRDRDVHSEMLQIERRDGSTIPVLVSASKVHASGNADIVLVLRDVTDIAEREKELRNVSERAVAADRAKSEFIATMSHELRTPLNCIIGFSSLMDNELLGPVQNEKYKEYIGDIRGSGQQLLGIINDILDIASIEAGRTPLRLDSTDLWAICRSACVLARDRARAKSIAFVASLPDEPCLVQGDEVKLKQVFQNLLSNAVKFTGAGGRVEVRGAKDADGQVVLEIADTGIGMTEEQLRRAVMPFGLADSSHTRVHGGTGLGLPLAIRLTELHGGRLELASQMGVGTTVTFRLPPNAASAGDAPAGTIAVTA